MWRRLAAIVSGWDGVLLSFVLLLVGVGLAELYSSSLARPELTPLFWRQLAGLTLGCVALVVAASIDYRTYRSWARLTYAASLAVLVLVLVFGTTIRGTTGWFQLGSFNFQPVELVKFLWVLVLASYLSYVGPPLTAAKTIGAAALMAPLLGLVLLQPDLGSGSLFVAAWATLLAAVPKPRRWWYVMGTLVLVLGLTGSFFLKGYQRDRILTFLSPQADPLGRGYNVTQSVIAVGAGEWWGRGLGLGTQSQLKFLPEQHTDFIFASIAEELGLVGGALVLALTAGFLARLVWLMRRLRDDFAVLLAVGFFIVFAVQAALNIAMNLGLAPVVGLTLPFVSYGGSSLVVSLAAVGVLENLARHFKRQAPSDALTRVDRASQRVVY